MTNFNPWPQLLQRIQDHGWAIQPVLGDGTASSYSYTVGLCLKKLPDLLIVGLGAENALPILDEAARRLTTFGFKGEEGDILHGLANMPLAPRLTSPELSGEAALAARNFATATEKPFACIQLVIPDRHGLFPWQPGYDPAMHRIQRLYLPQSSAHQLELPEALRRVVGDAPLPAAGKTKRTKPR